MLGDSCHAPLPTSAQGASQATESGAVLALCLKLAGKDNIPLAGSEAAINPGGSNFFQTRVYEKLRFERVRKSQLNGEDVRDRWHNVLKNLHDDVEIDPEDVEIRVSVLNTDLRRFADEVVNDRIDGCIHLMLKRIPYSDGKRFRRKYQRSSEQGIYLLYLMRLRRFKLHKSTEIYAESCM